jgi:hypothetical protein
MANDLMTGPPDFIGVGTQRSGTSWWFALLQTHPRVVRPRGSKELHWFTQFASRELRDKDIARYHAKFPRAAGQLAGEWTPRYMHDFWTARSIRRAAPDAKLLVLLRDPIERLRSGIPREVGVDDDRGEARSYRDIVADAIDRGRYATQLKRLRAGHPDAEVLVLQFEQCVADPAGQYIRTLEFLGLDTDVPLPDFQKRRGGSQAAKKRELWPDLLEAMQVTLEDDVLELGRMHPDLDLSLWRNFAYVIDRGPHAAVR